MMKNTRIVEIAFVCLFSATGVHAQQKRRQKFDLFVEGGGSFFVPRSTTTLGGIPAPEPIGPVVALLTVRFQDSGRLSAGFDFWFSRHDAVQASYSYSSADYVQATTPIDPPIGGAMALVPNRLHLLSFNYLHSFSLSTRWGLFLDAGIGRAWWLDPVGGPTPSGLAANLGTGISFRITNHWSVRAEYKDYILRLPTEPYVGGLVHNNSPTIGIAYHF